MTAQYRHSRDVTCPSYLQASYLQLEYLDWLKEGRYGSVHAGVIYSTGIRTLYTEEMRVMILALDTKSERASQLEFT